MWEYRRKALEVKNGMGPNGRAPFGEMGQWVCVEAKGRRWAPQLADCENDRDTDSVVVSLGLNARYEPSPEEPVRIYAKDFDQDEAVEAVETRSLQGTRYPIHEREDLLVGFRGMLPRIPSHPAYADASFEDLFTREERRGLRGRGHSLHDQLPGESGGRDV